MDRLRASSEVPEKVNGRGDRIVLTVDSNETGFGGKDSKIT